MGISDLSENKLSYIAGLFDGEGCITITKTIRKNNRPYYQLVVIILMAEPEFLDKLHEDIGLGKVYKIKNADKEHHKDRSSYRMANTNAEIFIKALLPFLVLKKNEALTALQFLETFKDQNPYKRSGLSTEILTSRQGFMDTMKRQKNDRG